MPTKQRVPYAFWKSKTLFINADGTAFRRFWGFGHKVKRVWLDITPRTIARKQLELQKSNAALMKNDNFKRF